MTEMAKAPKAKKKSVTAGIAYITASFNNTTVTITDARGDTLCWASGGTCGFKGSRKGTPFAGQCAAQQAAEKALKALLADRDQDLRSHSLAALLRALGGEAPQQWAAQARTLDKLYAPTRYPDALGDVAPMDVFGPEDAAEAMHAATAFLDWAAATLRPLT